jgi:hypothetical protein
MKNQSSSRQPICDMLIVRPRNFLGVNRASRKNLFCTEVLIRASRMNCQDVSLAFVEALNPYPAGGHPQFKCDVFVAHQFRWS